MIEHQPPLQPPESVRMPTKSRFFHRSGEATAAAIKDSNITPNHDERAIAIRLQNPDGRRYHPVTRTFHSFPLFLALSRLLRIAEKVPFFLPNDVLVCSSFYLLELSLSFQFYHYRLQRGFCVVSYPSDSNSDLNIHRHTRPLSRVRLPVPMARDNQPVGRTNIQRVLWY